VQRVCFHNARRGVLDRPIEPGDDSKRSPDERSDIRVFPVDAIPHRVSLMRATCRGILFAGHCFGRL
jgi:hypothetical protein